MPDVRAAPLLTDIESLREQLGVLMLATLHAEAEGKSDIAGELASISADMVREIEALKAAALTTEGETDV